MEKHETSHGEGNSAAHGCHRVAGVAADLGFAFLDGVTRIALDAHRAQYRLRLGDGAFHPGLPGTPGFRGTSGKGGELRDEGFFFFRGHRQG